MTTAARPTWNAAKGGYTGRDLNFQTRIFHAKEIASHTKIKYRKRGQNSPAEIKERELTEKLIRAEQEFSAKKRKLLAQVESADHSPPASPLTTNPNNNTEQEEDDQDRDAQVSESDESDGHDDDSDDETEALMRELEKIKRERAEDRDRLEQERLRLEQEERDGDIATGNPLLHLNKSGNDFTIKKRWDDDVVFKHQARNAEKTEKRFINDTIRSDFHRKFLSKYIK